MIVDSLWTSKLRYVLQLWATLRLEETQPKKKVVVDVQKTQNRLLRILERKRIGERKSVKDMLKNQSTISVNQMAAQIKMVEIWKAKNVERITRYKSSSSQQQRKEEKCGDS